MGSSKTDLSIAMADSRLVLRSKLRLGSVDDVENGDAVNVTQIRIAHRHLEYARCYSRRDVNHWRTNE